jgi:hypothetical protein
MEDERVNSLSASVSFSNTGARVFRQSVDEYHEYHD